MTGFLSRGAPEPQQDDACGCPAFESRASPDPQQDEACGAGCSWPQGSLGPQQASFCPVRAAIIMAVAQPTPLSTVTAPVGQFF